MTTQKQLKELLIAELEWDNESELTSVNDSFSRLIIQDPISLIFSTATLRSLLRLLDGLCSYKLHKIKLFCVLASQNVSLLASLAKFSPFGDIFSVFI